MTSDDSLADQPEARPFSAKMDGARAVVCLDGHEIQDRLAGFRLEVVAGELPVAVLQLSARAAGMSEFDGLARVVVEDVMSDPGPAAAVFLSAIDPEELERHALERADLGSERHALTKAMLRQLQEWAHGRS